MESLGWSPILLACAGSVLVTAIVFMILVIRDRRST